MAKVDLHLHTTYSDGRLTPEQLVSLCAQRGLSVISISDHDSTEGLSEAMETADRLGVEVIPGIELSTDVPSAEVHMLGYFVEVGDPELQGILQRFRDGRQDRARETVERLAELGVEVSWERVQELSGGGAVGRPHIAQAMVDAGYVKYPKEAFDRYLGRDGPAYLDRSKLTPADAIGILLKNGALPVMAHPTYAVPESEADKVAAMRRLLQDLKGHGLVGVEVYYKDYTPQQVQQLAELADELGLVPCGGSDYHASGNPDEPEPGTVGPPIQTVEALRSLKKQRAARA